MSEIDYAALILRCWVGVVMLAHGINHARSLEGTSRWFAKVGFRSPDLNARLSAFNEIAVGVILIAGFLTPVAAAAVAGTMLVAFWSIHRFAGFFVFRRPDEGYEYVATLVEQIRAGRAKAGLLTVLERLAPVLAELAPRRADDTNELPDAVLRS